MDVNRKEQFMNTYRETLSKLMFEKSEFYKLTFLEMCNRMETHLVTGKANRNASSFRITCEKLGIPPKGMAARNWVNGQPPDKKKSRSIK